MARNKPVTESEVEEIVSRVVGVYAEDIQDKLDTIIEIQRTSREQSDHRRVTKLEKHVTSR